MGVIKVALARCRFDPPENHACKGAGFDFKGTPLNKMKHSGSVRCGFVGGNMKGIFRFQKCVVNVEVLTLEWRGRDSVESQ